MSSQHPDRAPERLIHGKFGHLLREANRQLEAQLDEPAAFQRITERLAASRRQRLAPWLRWLVPAMPFAVAAVAAIILAHERRSNAVPELAAERWNAPPQLATPPVTSASGVEAAPLVRAERLGEPRGEPKKDSRAAQRSAALAPGPRSASAAPEPASSTTASSTTASSTTASSTTASEPPVGLAAEPPPGAPDPAASAAAAALGTDCLGLARHGQTRGAEACFLERAKGSGLAAEMALYEVARLRRDVLADADGALRALAEYRSRFPAGSLRREADMSQLELLLQLGRSEAALKQTEELLSSSASGERATELRLLRGHVLRKKSRFAEAAREYELADGARAGEAIYFRALCLEALGRTSDAAASFTKYLEQPQRPYAEDARRRLERLKP